MTHIVTTYQQLYDSIRYATAGDTISIQAIITCPMPGELEVIANNLTITCTSTGLLIYTGREYFPVGTNPNPIGCLRILASNCHLKGLKIHGKRKVYNSSEDGWRTDGIQCLVRVCDGTGFKATSSCVFRYSNHSAIWLDKTTYGLVAGCTFKDNDAPWFGYGIWYGPGGQDDFYRIYKNKFFKHRHCIAGHHNPNTIMIDFNTFDGDQVQQVIDRHADENKNSGGDTWIISNTFKTPNNFAFKIKGQPTYGRLIISDNTFARPEGLNGEIELQNGTEMVDANGTYIKNLCPDPYMIAFNGNIYPT